MHLQDVINQTCPWSGEAVVEDSLTRYNGHVVGFCCAGCRDKFEKAVLHFEAALSKEN